MLKSELNQGVERFLDVYVGDEATSTAHMVASREKTITTPAQSPKA